MSQLLEKCADCLHHRNCHLQEPDGTGGHCGATVTGCGGRAWERASCSCTRFRAIEPLEKSA